MLDIERTFNYQGKFYKVWSQCLMAYKERNIMGGNNFYIRLFFYEIVTLHLCCTFVVFYLTLFYSLNVLMWLPSACIVTCSSLIYCNIVSHVALCCLCVGKNKNRAIWTLYFFNIIFSFFTKKSLGVLGAVFNSR